MIGERRAVFDRRVGIRRQVFEFTFKAHILRIAIGAQAFVAFLSIFFFSASLSIVIIVMAFSRKPFVDGFPERKTSLAAKTP